MRGQQKLSIAIIGAGIGGLAVAAALRKFFIEPAIYERAESFARIGAGILQSPNAMKVHRWLGAEDRLRQVGFAPESLRNRDALSGKATDEEPLGRTVEARYGAPFLTLHHGDLHAALRSVVPTQNLRLGKTLTRIASDGARVQLSFADGSEAEADAAIGADGVHSLLRSHVGETAPPRFTGRTAGRAIVPASLLQGIDIGASLTHWWGRDRHVTVSYATARQSEVCFATSQPEKADGMTQESWSTTADPAEMRAAFASFHSDVQRLLAAAPELHQSAIYERDPLPAWSKGRVVLLGDACHPMTPDTSGAAMALEDAAVLARSIDEADSLEAAFRLYETTRKPRASVVQAGSGRKPRSDSDPGWLYGYNAATVPLRSKLAADASTYYES